MFQIHPNAVMPFCGVLESFDEIYEQDLKIRFQEFYEEFFYSLDLNKAYQNLIDANEKLDADYRYYLADELFLKSYKGYIEKECSPESIEKRAKECFDPSKGDDLGAFIIVFSQCEKEQRNEDYRELRDKFFMINKFPQNLQRFNLPNTTEELLSR